MTRSIKYELATETKVVYSHSLEEHPRWGAISPDGKFYYHCIPKNASSYLSGVFKDWGWTEVYESTQPRNLSNSLNICVIRDPLARWVSGITEFLSTVLRYDEVETADWNLIFRMLYNQPEQDAHTAPQTTYLFNYNLREFNYFFMSEHLSIGDPLYTWLNTRGYKNLLANYERQNTTRSSPLKFAISQKVQANLDDNFLARLKDNYKADYELIEWIGNTKTWSK